MEDVPIQIPLDRIPLQVYGAALVIVVVGAIAIAIAIWVVLRRARRSDFWRAATRQSRIGLARSAPHRTIEQLRAQLDEAVMATNAMVDLARDKGWALGALPTLVRQLTDVGDQLDHRLHLLGLEAPAVVTSQLPLVQTQTQRLIRIAADIRTAATSSLRRTLDASLSALDDDQTIQTDALEAALDEVARATGS